MTLSTLARRGTAVAATALALTAVGATAAPGALAVERHTVCAQNLYVREQPEGRVIGTLYYGQTFDLERYSPSGQWAYGYAYGHVNAHGWVQAGWFC
jgi:hypothetical protein